MAELTPKLGGGGGVDNIVTQKNVEEKEPDNIVTKKVVEETKQKLIKPTENVESDFEIISKENPTSEEKTAVRVESKKEEVADIKEVEKKLENDHKSSGTEERKKSIVDISVIQEATIQKGNDLQESVSSMPGMTKSVSQEILKKSDVTELKQIAQDLAEEDRQENKEEEEEGSVIDISVVEESTEKVEDIGTVDGLEAEILADDEEVTITPGEDEQVVELTLTTRHILPLVSAMVALVAAIYGLIFYTNV